MKNSLREPLEKLSRQTNELAKNTASAAEFLAETLRAETRHLAFLAVEIFTAKLTGYQTPRKRDSSLEPLAGVGAITDPRSDLSQRTASVSEDQLSRF